MSSFAMRRLATGSSVCQQPIPESFGATGKKPTDTRAMAVFEGIEEPV